MTRPRRPALPERLHLVMTWVLATLLAAMLTRLSGLWFWLVLVCFLLTLGELLPRRWRQVLTARRPADERPVSYPSGPASVVLDAVGDRPIQVVKQVREATGLGLAAAQAVLDSPSGVVLEGVDVDSAERVARALSAAGASARVALLP